MCPCQMPKPSLPCPLAVLRSDGGGQNVCLLSLIFSFLLLLCTWWFVCPVGADTVLLCHWEITYYTCLFLHCIETMVQWRFPSIDGERGPPVQYNVWRLTPYRPLVCHIWVTRLPLVAPHELRLSCGSGAQGMQWTCFPAQRACSEWLPVVHEISITNET